jgi:hypothetical protein
VSHCCASAARRAGGAVLAHRVLRCDPHRTAARTLRRHDGRREPGVGGQPCPRPTTAGSCPRCSTRSPSTWPGGRRRSPSGRRWSCRGHGRAHPRAGGRGRGGHGHRPQRRDGRARRPRVPAARWQQADAMRLPFDDATLRPRRLPVRRDVLPRQARAFAEVARVLAPGAGCDERVGPARHPRLRGRAGHRAGRVFPDDPPTFMSAVPHGYADPTCSPRRRKRAACGAKRSPR